MIMLPDADLSDPDAEDCLDDEILLLLDPLALHESDYSNDSYTDLMLKYVTVKYPDIVQRYNQFIDGTDLHDMFMSLYKIDHKSEK